MNSAEKSFNESPRNTFVPLNKIIYKKCIKKRHFFKRGIKKTLRIKKDKPYISSKYRWVELPLTEEINQSEFKMRLMTFNILAECNIYSELYPKVNPEHLKWEHREPRIIKLVTELNPDIACLQEFQPTLSENFVQAVTRAGYKFDFKRKTGKKEEGCLILWKEDKFQMVFHFHVDMNFVDKLDQLSFLDKDNIAQIVVLKSKTSDRHFIIANTHLIYNMGRGELKLGQILILLKSLHEVNALCDKIGLTSRNTFICGDFNSIPNSLLYDIFSQSKFNLDHVPSTQISNQCCARDLDISDEVKHFMETTTKFSMHCGESSDPILDARFIDALLKVRAVMACEQGKFDYTIESDDQKTRETVQPCCKADFGLENTFFQSTYAYVNKEYYRANPNDISTNVNRMIYNIKQKKPSFNEEKCLTFENGVSHISSEFKANVDYIWFNLNNKLRPFRVLELLSYDQLHKDENYPNADHPSDHFPLVADFYEP